MTLIAVNGQATDLSSKQDSRFSNVDALIIKVTKRCNLDCEYCYENITKSGDMDIAIFREIAEKAFFSSSKNKIELIFHGGEPTLLPDHWYVEAFHICQTLEKLTGKKASLSIQTNLTHLTDKKLELFRDNKVSVGASLDGSATLIASMRPGAERVIKNFLKARENGLKIGVLMTINHSNFDKFKESTEWLFHEMDVTAVLRNIGDT